ncbi:Hypothetical protein PHPALM_7022 [Phytophthora palmivora]|uniref:ATP-grasp domain-containing protein n=1 Tax=Phytophthora palmivora TaxID=4796 RepID=A0A2P4YDD3_9STRA|nr:Hypothetical protein PHPALM_7022 [Phytophthora palmivora]
MEARDAIISWLEQSDNFLRITASSPFSPSTRCGRSLRDVAQTETQALNELATFVNKRLPRINWDAKHVKQMLKHYLMEYRATAEAAANPLFSLDERDELRGIKTVKEKLNNMCRHFQRMQQLHNSVAIASKEREMKRKREQEDLPHNGQYTKLHFHLTEAQRSEREKDVVPESDLSNSCENSETDKTGCDKQQLMEKSAMPLSQLITLTSGNEAKEENLPVLRRSKRQLAKSENGSGIQQRRTTSVEIADVPTQTTQATSCETSQDAPIEKLPSGDTHYQVKKRKTVHKIVKPSQPPSSDQAPTPQRRVKDSPISAFKDVSSTKSSVPESLRSAIAQVVLQRQQLLSRQDSLSGSDYEIRSNAKSVAEPRPAQDLPPFDRDARPNLRRKRAFLRAKEFAFEQLRWQRENAFQQLEMDLLHREMEMRQILAQQELNLKRMHIRAEIIQSMIRTGANFHDIVERLQLLKPLKPITLPLKLQFVMTLPVQSTSESQRDAIVAWLEQGDNFLRVTAFSTSSGPHARLGISDGQEAECMENKALSDLAESVNVASPRSHWDGKHAKQMLKHYLMEFKSTAREAAKPSFTLSKTDEVFGIQTIEDKLNSMCPHFGRLQRLHTSRLRAAMRGSTSMEMVKGLVQAKIPRTSELAKVRPRKGIPDQSNHDAASFKPPEETEAPAQTVENSGRTTGNGLKIGLESAKGDGDSVTKYQESKKSSPKKTGKKRAVSETYKQQHSKKKKDKEELKDRVFTMPKFTELSSDEDEEDEDLPFLRSNAAVKVRRRLRQPGSAKSTDSDDDDSPWLKRKLRRVKSSPGKIKQAEAKKTPLRITRSSTSNKTPTHDKIPARVTRSSPNRSKKSPGNGLKSSRTIAQGSKPVKPPSKTTATEKNSAKKGSSAADAPTLKNKPPPLSEKDSEAGTIPDSVLFAGQLQGREAAADTPQTMVPARTPPVTQAPVALQSVKQSSASPHAVSPTSNTPNVGVQASQVVVVQSTSAQPRFHVPDALRSAIAQVVSQRQELLNSRLRRRQENQPDNSDSDYERSEEERSNPNTLPNDQERKAHVASNGHHNDQESLAATPGSYSAVKVVVNSRKLSDQRSPVVSRTSITSSHLRSASRPKPSLVAGHIPPLLNFPRTNSEDMNIDRKLAFLNAKKLAFEQFKWMCENELQQQEMELLRREMETRKAFARKEIELQQMSIRVDLIQRMIRVGASIEDITEQLMLLY